MRTWETVSREWKWENKVGDIFVTWETYNAMIILPERQFFIAIHTSVIPEWNSFGMQERDRYARKLVEWLMLISYAARMTAVSLKEPLFYTRYHVWCSNKRTTERRLYLALRRILMNARIPYLKQNVRLTSWCIYTVTNPAMQ